MKETVQGGAMEEVPRWNYDYLICKELWLIIEFIFLWYTRYPSRILTEIESVLLYRPS